MIRFLRRVALLLVLSLLAVNPINIANNKRYYVSNINSGNQFYPGSRSTRR